MNDISKILVPARNAPGRDNVSCRVCGKIPSYPVRQVSDGVVCGDPCSKEFEENSTKDLVVLNDKAHIEEYVRSVSGETKVIEPVDKELKRDLKAQQELQEIQKVTEEASEPVKVKAVSGQDVSS